MGRVFFPLDQELELLPGEYTPTLVEDMVRLGARIEFGPAAAEIGRLKKVQVSKPTVRRDTEKAGDAYVEVQTEQLAALEKDLPPAPLGPPLQQMSVDGVMVPLLHAEWGEVKSMVIGTIGAPVLEKGEWVVHTTDLSYFSRLTDHETFTRAATVETHRRGTETAGTVCAINDGAEWEQKLVDHHRPDAVRILDWGHSSQYVAQAGHAVFGRGSAASSEWLGQQLHELKHGDPQKVLAELRRLRDGPTAGETELASEAVKAVRTSLEYLEKRQEMIRYAEFTAAGYPIGSGAIESGNKLVIERRLKGPGMHWAREHVDGMAALRNALCSDRWDEGWTELSARWRQTVRERAAKRRGKRREVASAVRAVPIPSPTSAATRPKPVVASVDVHPTPIASFVATRPPDGPRRPAADHPWRHSPIGRARYTRASSPCSTET